MNNSLNTEAKELFNKVPEVSRLSGIVPMLVSRKPRFSIKKANRSGWPFYQFS